MKKLKKNKGKLFYLKYPQKKSNTRNKFNEGCKRPLQRELQITEEID
jgi:hypothetical protein